MMKGFERCTAVTIRSANKESPHLSPEVAGFVFSSLQRIQEPAHDLIGSQLNPSSPADSFTKSGIPDRVVLAGETHLENVNRNLRAVHREISAAQRGFPTSQPVRSLVQTFKSTIEMLGYAPHVVGLGERQAAAENEVRNPAFKRIPRSIDEIRVVDQIEADFCAKCFVISAAGHLTEAAADVTGAVMGPGPVAIASAVDIVDQLNSKIRIARK